MPCIWFIQKIPQSQRTGLAIGQIVEEIALRRDAEGCGREARAPQRICVDAA